MNAKKVLQSNWFWNPDFLLADCVLPAFPSNGNVTCGNLLPEGNDYRLIYGQSCLLTCRAGFVSLELRESRFVLLLLLCFFIVVVAVVFRWRFEDLKMFVEAGVWRYLSGLASCLSIPVKMHTRWCEMISKVRICDVLHTVGLCRYQLCNIDKWLSTTGTLLNDFQLYWLAYLCYNHKEKTFLWSNEIFTFTFQMFQRSNDATTGVRTSWRNADRRRTQWHLRSFVQRWIGNFIVIIKQSN